MGVTRRFWIWIAASIALLVIGLGAAVWICNPLLTRTIEGSAFRAELDRETAKGLHFQTGHYEAIKRTGFLSASGEGFRGTDGKKAMRFLHASGISADFNPWAIFLRRWQLENVHIASGNVGIQVYEPKPDNHPPKPWYAIFLPNRVYLQDVVCDTADVTWKIQKREGGFYKTRLHITPHGRDFNYEATGGTMRNPFMPELHLQRVYMLITKQLLTLYELHLTEGKKGNIVVKAHAGMKDDKSMNIEAHFDDLSIAPWTPDDWKGSFNGSANGEILWTSKSQKINDSSGHASLFIRNVRITNAPLLDSVAAVTKKDVFRDLHLDEFSLHIKWDYPKIEIQDIDIEAKGIFRIRGNIVIDKKDLSGTLQLGFMPEYLGWFPHPEKIFTRTQDGFLLTPVHFSGTLDEPKEDLSPRMIKLFTSSPAISLAALLRLIGNWIGNFF